MIGSRLRERRVQVTCDILQRNSSSVSSNVYTSLLATHTQEIATEILAEFGNVVTEVSDIFFFEPLTSTGALPVILEKHIVSAGGASYEIVAVVDQGGEGNRLAVATKRVR